MGRVSGCIGRALEWHSRGKGFDPPHLHQKKASAEKQVPLFVLFAIRHDHIATPDSALDTLSDVVFNDCCCVVYVSSACIVKGFMR